MSGIKTKIRRLIYKLRHDYLNLENVFLIAAIVLCLTLTYQSIMAMTRNWELSEKLGAEKRQLELLSIQVEKEQLENDYYKSDEYQELLARKFLDKQLTGEKMVVLPDNTEKAKNKHIEKNEDASERTYSNFEKWMMYLFPNY